MAKPAPSRVAAALQYLQQMRDRAAEFGGGVVDTLADRARDVGGLAYEALTSDPNIGRMTTAEFADAAAARAPTPRLNAMGQGAVELGRAVLTQPVETGKALVRGEVERFRSATESPRAMGQYAGEFVNPLRLAAALRRGPMLELEGYQGSPHKFEPTPNNPLGELDSSKIGTGEGAQAYGHGIYIAENRKVGEGYKKALSGYEEPFLQFGDTKITGQKLSDVDLEAFKFLEIGKRDAGQFPHNTVYYAKQAAKNNPAVLARLEEMGRDVKFGYEKNPGYLYTLDLPDEMIDRMLDWDKPLSEQPEAVRKALKDAYRADWLGDESKQTGQDLYKRMGKMHGDDIAAVSRDLRDIGIPGIRYLDAGSRGKDGTGTRNFVVFPGEEKKVKVLRRE
jgi:hypothetical protein